MATEVTAGTQTLDRALSALMRIGESGRRGLTLAECSATLGYSKATTHRMLRTLAARGFLRVDPERGLYTLGPNTLRLGMTFLEQLDIRAEALPVLRELGERTGETVHLGVLEDGEVIYIEKIESTHAVRMFSRIGHTMPAYSTGIGKAILAHLRPDELAEALPERLQPRTPATITAPKALVRHLAEIRRRGYSTDDVENEDGIRCVGAAVFDHSGEACAGISVAGPESRVTVERFPELGELVREAAMSVSRRIGYVPERDLVETG